MSVQNPNVFVRNFPESYNAVNENIIKKNDVFFSGTLSEQKVVELSCPTKYIIFRVNITTAATNAGYSLRIYRGNNYSNPDAPVLKDLHSGATISSDRVLRLTFTGEKYVYADVSMFKDLKVQLSVVDATPQPVLSVYYTFVDTLPSPDIYINNFPEYQKILYDGIIKKNDILFSGELTATSIYSLTCPSKFVLFRINVTTAAQNIYYTFRTYRGNSYDNPDAPILKVLGTNESLVQNRIRLNFSGVVYLYADVSVFQDLKAELTVGSGAQGAGAPTLSVYYAFVNELPNTTTISNLSELKTNGVQTAILKETWKDGIVNAGEYIQDIVTDKPFILLRVNLKALTYISPSIYSILNLYVGSNNTPDYPVLHNLVSHEAYPNGFQFNQSTNVGEYWLYANTEVIKNLGLRLSIVGLEGSDAQRASLTIQYAFVDELPLYDKDFLDGKKAVIKVPYSPIILKYIGDTTYCWKNYRLKVTNQKGITLYKDNDNVILSQENVELFFGSTINAYNKEQLILPFLSSMGEPTNNTWGGVSLIISANNGKYFFCDITSDINSIRTQSNWIECNFWEKYDSVRRIPTKNTSLASNPLYRVDTTLPDEMYGYEATESHHIQYQGVPSIHSLGPIAVSKKMVAIATYRTDGGRINLWVTTDGGRNFYSVYDFSHAWDNIPAANRDTFLPKINTSGFQSFNNDLRMYKITSNIPSAEAKEPAHPYTLSEAMSVGNISSASACVVTINNHGLSSGDIVCFESLTNTDWKQLSNTGFSADSKGSNVYYVDVIDTNSFYLRYFNGSYDTQLTARHIHSVTECQQGFLFGTGEHYPNGWEMLLEVTGIMGTVVGSENHHIVRLNSTQTSVQRICGAYLTKEKNPYLICFIDTGLILNNYCNEKIHITGRTDTVYMTSYGVWKGKLEDIDDFTKFEKLLDIPEPAIWAYRYRGIVLAYFQLGGFAISRDDGETYTYIDNMLVTEEINQFNGILNGQLVIGNGYVIELDSNN